MSKLEDDVLVSSLSIPGTHDSAAYTRPWPYIATQKMDIRQQLNAGIRYFDLRCGIRDDVAEMVHGPSLLGLRLSEVLGSMYRWLDTHPTEGLIVQIKEDREPERSNIHFSQAIFGYISARSDRWRTANTTPVLGELRGRIQLFRRYQGPSRMAYGISVNEWRDNPSRPFTITTRHCVQLTIQDHYNFPDPTSLPALIATKGGDVSGLLDRASKDSDDSHWYLNFTSAFEFNLYYQLPPRQVAVGGYYRFSFYDGMNPRLRTYLRQRKGKNRFGIIAMDFPEIGTDDLIATIIKSNYGPRQKIWIWQLVALLLMFAFVYLLAGRNYFDHIYALLVTS